MIQPDIPLAPDPMTITTSSQRLILPNTLKRWPWSVLVQKAVAAQIIDVVELDYDIGGIWSAKHGFARAGP